MNVVGFDQNRMCIVQTLMCLWVLFICSEHLPHLFLKGISEPPRMAVVLHRIEFVQQIRS